MNKDITHLPKYIQADLKAILGVLIPKYSEIEMVISLVPLPEAIFK